MKNLITLSMAFMMMLIAYSCQPKSEPCPECPKCPEKHPNGLYALSATDTLDTLEFNTMVAAWNANYRNYMANDSLHYFDMPVADLTTILGHNKTALNDGVRLYMGMKNDKSGVLRPHLMMVGTKSGQSDMSVIADYTSSCPNQCPEL